MTHLEQPQNKGASRMVKICWRHKPSGYQGCGNPIARNLAEEWLKSLEADDPDTEYWIEEAKEQKDNVIPDVD